MNWFTELFTEHTFIQAVTVLSLISATGLALGNIKIFGISFGVTFVFFAGIIAGHFGISIDPEMLALAQNFGLILYIYALGVQVGPGFFSSFKHGGIKLNLLALLLLLLGSLMAIIIFYIRIIICHFLAPYCGVRKKGVDQFWFGVSKHKLIPF